MFSFQVFSKNFVVRYGFCNALEELKKHSHLTKTFYISVPLQQIGIDLDMKQFF